MSTYFRDMSLAVFADWLIENVYFVEVTASADTDAYAIFETMNDRGLSLTPVDMLKSYLLSQIDDRRVRGAVNETWKYAGLRLPGRGEKIHEMVCRCGGRVPIREVWRARRTTATIRRDLGVSGTLGTCASNASNETRRS